MPIAYIITQVVAGLAAGALLLGVANGKPGFSTKISGLAANGYGAHSPGHYSLAACFIIEVLLTAFFLYVIIGVTDSRALNQFAPIAIGLTLTIIHLISIPITNTSVNPARSTAVAFFAGNGAAGQLWLFWVAPILGAPHRRRHLPNDHRHAGPGRVRQRLTLARSRAAGGVSLPAARTSRSVAGRRRGPWPRRPAPSCATPRRSSRRPASPRPSRRPPRRCSSRTRRG